MPVLHVIDANSPWVRSLAAGMPEDWSIRHYRIYNPLWLPSGIRDVPRIGRWVEVDHRTRELYLATPGWRRFEKLSTRFLNTFLPKRNEADKEDVFLFTFPFYSSVAAGLREKRPGSTIVYWAHDAFAYYEFAPGYVEHHENRLVPLCDARFAMAPLLVDDYARRYPDHPFHLLHDAVSSDFLTRPAGAIPREIEAIRNLGRPVVGCIGQINRNYDWDLLESASSANPGTQFVFIGNLFEEGEITNRIRRFFDRGNVHWLGRIEHGRLPDYLHAFDICLNPLSISDHNHRRDPLRIYDYLTTTAPIISTDLDGVRMHREHVGIFASPADLISRLGTMPDPINEQTLAKRRAYIHSHRWEDRAEEFIKLLSTNRNG